jgi:putative hydrolase of the HAD superfamily
VFSSEIGRRKPDAAIFEHALGAIGVDAADALFVGDTLATDIAGAAALGMRTCQAVWFRADESGDVEPEFQAFTQMGVLTIAGRLR